MFNKKSTFFVVLKDIPSFKLQDSGKDNDSMRNKKLKKGYICESILSLLVKIVYANKLTELENKSDDNKTADARNFTLEFDFLNRNSLADDFYAYRIGDESDFIVNVLEKAAKLDHKCNLIIVKTLETLNSAKKQQQLQQDQNQQQANVNSDQQTTTQSNENGDTNSLSSPAKTSNVDFLSKTSPSADDDLKYVEVWQLFVTQFNLLYYLRVAPQELRNLRPKPGSKSCLLK